MRFYDNIKKYYIINIDIKLCSRKEVNMVNPAKRNEIIDIVSGQTKDEFRKIKLDSKERRALKQVLENKGEGLTKEQVDALKEKLTKRSLKDMTKSHPFKYLKNLVFGLTLTQLHKQASEAKTEVKQENKELDKKTEEPVSSTLKQEANEKPEIKTNAKSISSLSKAVNNPLSKDEREKIAEEVTAMVDKRYEGSSYKKPIMQELNKCLEEFKTNGSLILEDYDWMFWFQDDISTVNPDEVAHASVVDFFKEGHCPKEISEKMNITILSRDE